MTIRTAVIMLFFLLPAGITAASTSAFGSIDKLLIGRLGNEVYVHLRPVPDIDCAPLHPLGYRYIMFLDKTPAAAEMLSAMQTAWASGRPIRIQGTGACVSGGNDINGLKMEQIAYVILGNS